MKSFFYLSFVVLLAAFTAMWSGCGGSRKTVDQGQNSAGEESSEGEYDEIERLLGISRDDGKSSEKSAAQEDRPKPKKEDQDDLIRLLEADEGKPTDQTATGEYSQGEDKRTIRLQQQVDELQKEVRKKDMEIADLKTQLALKEEELNQKEGSRETGATYYSQPAQPSQTYQSSSGQSGEGSYGEKYQNALALFHDRNYQSAIGAFEQLLATDMNHQYSDNAQYWIGECYYALGNYREAIIAFEKVFTFPRSNKNDYAQFKIGQCYFKIGESERAKQEFQQLIDNYPESELVPRARNYLAQS